jgi:hypothetical protein
MAAGSIDNYELRCLGHFQRRVSPAVASLPLSHCYVGPGPRDRDQRQRIRFHFQWRCHEHDNLE